MSQSFEKKLDLIIIIGLIITLPLLSLDQQEHFLQIYLFTILFIITYIIRNFIFHVDLHSLKGGIILFIQLFIALAINIYDNSFISEIYLLVLVGEAAMHRTKQFSIPFSFLAYTFFVIGRFINYPSFESLHFIIPKSLEFVSFFALSYLAKIIVNQKQQLAKAYESIKKAALSLEENTLFAERTRISREIHDTIGHTLTTTIMGVKASNKLIDHDKKKAKQLLNDIQIQLQNGLNDVRKSVKLLNNQQSFIEFLPSITSLLEDTIDQTGITIDYHIDAPNLHISPKQELVIYRALQEGLTNGIRHGPSTHFEFLLYKEDSNTIFKLIDNGRGFDIKQATLGFGLISMQERVRELKGEWLITSLPNNGGTELMISLPSISQSQKYENKKLG
ncbi:sensor histidine kinase [Virgibacillus salarius]|uniref:sensor histidine kinase n=1 Tax=Virgibacillus TaxID=84406 RepID=UPI0024912804|nr:MULTISPECIES: sensor histidine kinase [Virgibacillus]MDY7042632.1 sensor histidine kinase [Virgibacillus sp. M23]WBX79334.1 sensor histidine kinase [Virgibacillus salarius]